MPEKQNIEIVYQDGSREGLLVSFMAPNLYRLEESSLLGEGVFGDVIEAELRPDGRLQFKRVASASEMNTVSCILTPAQMSAPGLQALLERVMSLGGNWERAFDGVLLVHLPKSVDVDVEAEIRALTAAAPVK